ncbi:MAG: UbiD family decarboxylase, partial [Candidatus Binataceae bacterium]
MPTKLNCPSDLREYISRLEAVDELRRVRTEIDWRYEAGAMSRLVCERRGPAPLFENIKGYPEQSLAGVLLGPSKPYLLARAAIAMGLDKSTPQLELIEIARERFRSPHPPLTVSRDSAQCKEVVMDREEADLLRFPVPWIKEIDGGRYVGTWDIIVTKDPDTGWVNWGIYRCMAKDEQHFAILLLPADQHGGGILKKYEARNQPMPIALVIGADPLSHLASRAPLPHGSSEADIAGGLRGEGVPVVKCETSDLEVPANAELVIEAEVIAGQRVHEGPFGEYTGHAAHQGMAPLARVTCITHRLKPVFTFANMGKPWDDSAVTGAVVESAAAKNWLEDHGVRVKSIYYYVPNIVVVSVKPAPGLTKRIVGILTGGHRLLESGIVVVDEDVDVTDPADVWWAICSRMHPRRYEVIDNMPNFLPLWAWLTPEERAKREAPCWIMDTTFPHEWPRDYLEAHTRVSDFRSAWSEESQRMIL